MDDKARFQIDNLSELKKLTQLAESQLNQLKQTLELTRCAFRGIPFSVD